MYLKVQANEAASIMYRNVTPKKAGPNMYLRVKANKAASNMYRRVTLTANKAATNMYRRETANKQELTRIEK